MDGRPNRRNKAPFSNFSGVGVSVDAGSTFCQILDMKLN